MKRFEPRKRTALDGVVWWVVWDLKENKYSTFTCFGRYPKKKDCQFAIDYYSKEWGLQK